MRSSLVRMPKLAKDPSIIHDSKYASKEAKRFDSVSIHQMLDHGGRHSMSTSFKQQRRSDRNISLEVIDVIKETPADGGVLVFTFKARPGDINMADQLQRDLMEAGINPAVKLPNGKSRFCWLP